LLGVAGGFPTTTPTSVGKIQMTSTGIVAAKGLAKTTFRGFSPTLFSSISSTIIHTKISIPTKISFFLFLMLLFVLQWNRVLKKNLDGFHRSYP
jgi:hypothetical protein